MEKCCNSYTLRETISDWKFIKNIEEGERSSSRWVRKEKKKESSRTEGAKRIERC